MNKQNALRAAGASLLVFGLLLDPKLVGALLAHDGKIDSASNIKFINFVRSIMIIVSLFFIIMPAMIPAISRASLVFLMRHRIVFLFAIVIACLGAAELFARLLNYRPMGDRFASSEYVHSLDEGSPSEGGYTRPHPVLGYTYKPGRYQISMGNRAVGYRTYTATHLPSGQRITKPLEWYDRPPAEKSLWIFGCSFTYGTMVDDQESFPWLVRERLAGFEVVNFGVGGHGNVHNYLQFKEALERGEPKPVAVVVIYASFHDSRNIYLRCRLSETRGERWDSVQFPFARLHQGRLIIEMKPNVRTQLPLMRYLALTELVESAYNGFEMLISRSHEVTKAIMREFDALCRREGIVFIVAGIDRSSLTRDMLDDCRSHGIPAVDISVPLDQEGMTNAPFDAHPSAKAHRMYAEKLTNYLIEVLNLSVGDSAPHVPQ
jgi:hypothetical protein